MLWEQFHLLLLQPTQHNRVCPLESICGRDVNKHFCPNAVLLSSLYLGISLCSLSSSPAVRRGPDQWPGLHLAKMVIHWKKYSVNFPSFQISSQSTGNERKVGKTTVEVIWKIHKKKNQPQQNETEEEQEKEAILINWMWVKRLTCTRHE